MYEVTQAYYDLQAAAGRESLHRSRLNATEEIAAMVTARRGQELATVTEQAQADQLVAQAKFDLTRAQSETAIASTRFPLISAANIGPNLVHQYRTVSWLISMPRSCSRSSTFRSESGNLT